MLRRIASRVLVASAPAGYACGVVLGGATVREQQQTGSSMMMACATWTASQRRLFRAATSEENALIEVMKTKPKHVGRRVRQLLMGQNRRIAQFRNTVTFLMIVLQSKLQVKEISPQDAAIIIESVMRECLHLHQSDMAHLLFRAALRFKRFDVQLTVTCVRLLFESYRGNDAVELMAQLAKELQSIPDFRSLAMAAYIFSGNMMEATAIRQTIPIDKLTTEDYLALVHGFAKTEQWAAFNDVVDEVLASTRQDLNAALVISTAVRTSAVNPTLSENVFTAATQNRIALTPEAIGSVARIRLDRITLYDDVARVEETLKKELQKDDLGFPAATAIINRASHLLTRHFAKGDEVMLLKVNQLRNIVDSQIANNELDEIDPIHVVSVLKGYGVLGKTDEMDKCFHVFKKKAPAAVDSLVYVEVMRWHAFAGNVRAVLDLKQEMENENIYHHPRVFTLLFKALDRFYPKLTEKYYHEMRKTVTLIDAPMYAALLRSFGDLHRHDMVEDLYNEIKARADQGHPVYNENVVIHLLRAYKKNRVVFDNIIQVANRLQFLSAPNVQAKVIEGYSAQGRLKELDTLVGSLPQMSSPVFVAQLRSYAENQDLAGFTKTVEAMKAAGVEINDNIFSAVAFACSKWRDSAAVREIVNGVRAMVSVKTCRYYATSAILCARIGDFDTVDDLWNELRNSNIPISMDTFNRFLELNVQRQNMAVMQDVLKTMMERIPPNPVTTTTVVDMLGKMGRLAEMEVLIDEMSASSQVQPTIFTYHHAMHAYARHGDVAKMEAVRSRLRRDGFKENQVTFNILFEGYGRAKRYEHLPELINERHVLGVPMDDTGHAVLLNMFAKGRMADEVNKTVEAITAKGAASGLPNGGLSARMLASIAEAYSYVQEFANVERYVNLLLSHPGLRDTQIETVFLIYHRLRDLNKLETMLKRYGGSEFVYNVCVAAFAKMQNHERVAEILRVMVNKKYALHTNTAIVVSSLLLKAGNTELAHTVLRMKTASSQSLQRHEDDGDFTRRRPASVAEPEVGAHDPRTALDEDLPKPGEQPAAAAAAAAAA